MSRTGRYRVAFGILALSAFALTSPIGCGNPEEGTVKVSPAARARLRGGPAPDAAKAKGKGVVDVRQKSRRNPEE